MDWLDHKKQRCEVCMLSVTCFYNSTPQQSRPVGFFYLLSYVLCIVNAGPHKIDDIPDSQLA